MPVLSREQPKSASSFTVLGQGFKQASGAQVRPLPS
jgi:hypothetical protein